MPTVRRDAEVFTVPDRLAVLALRDVVLFPHVSMPLLVGRPASLAAVDSAMAEERYILLVTQRSGDTDEPAAADLYRGGVVARIAQLARAPSGAAKILVEGLARVRVTRYVPAGDHLRAQVLPVEEQSSPDEIDEVEALARRVVSLFEEYVSLHRRIPPEVVTLVQGADSTARQAFGIAAHLSVRVETRQSLLETTSLLALFRMLAEVLRSEIELLRLERKIDDEVRGSLFQNQREFYLQEQLKAIHRELGQDDGEDVEGLEAQIAGKQMPEGVQTRALREVRKLRRMSPLSPESTVARNYVDWLLALPWSERSDDVLDVAHARRVLDEDHYGLEEVKDRILDYIGVLSLVGRMEGPILCLVGPPGVGKTSLGRSIARQFLIPRQLRQNGLAPESVAIDADVVPAIIQGYTREAGVRELERRLARIARKLARRKAEENSAPPAADAAVPPNAIARVSIGHLKELLGTPPFDPAELTLESKVGVATGLAYTSVGGEVLEIEVSVVGGRGKLALTGTLGDVMKESASAALSYARSRAGALGIDREFHRNRDLHVHIPAGATPKDGPSAGIAIATAIVSALTGIPVRGDVAMTGEITLRGRVLPIGGLKEKAVAAHRNRVAHVLIPYHNVRDLDDLPAEVRSSVSFHPVKTMDEVLQLALDRRDNAAEEAQQLVVPAPGMMTH
jgi:ATP-dependent Lon protease